MLRILQATAVVIGACFAAGCATTMTVSSHVRNGLDISPYHTYDWGPAGPLPTGDPRLDQDPFFKDHVMGAVEKALAGKGIRLAGAGAPDLLIHYHASISNRIDVNRTESEYGHCQGADCQSWVIEYEAGTLVLDVVDARTNRLIWRGWAQDSVEDALGNQDTMAKKIDEAVTRMLARFPRP